MTKSKYFIPIVDNIVSMRTFPFHSPTFVSHPLLPFNFIYISNSAPQPTHDQFISAAVPHRRPKRLETSLKSLIRGESLSTITALLLLLLRRSISCYSAKWMPANIQPVIDRKKRQGLSAFEPVVVGVVSSPLTNDFHPF